MSKLFIDKDLIVIQQFSKKAVYTAPTKSEIARVIRLVDQGAAMLYMYYRCTALVTSADIEDSTVASILGISQKSVGNHRRKLRKAGLIHIERMFSEDKSVVRVFLGEDAVALHKAGLPAQCTNSRALARIKQKFSIRTSQELIDNIDSVVDEYTNNFESYTR